MFLLLAALAVGSLVVYELLGPDTSPVPSIPEPPLGAPSSAVTGIMTGDVFELCVVGLEFDAERESPVSVDVWSIIGQSGPPVFIGADAPLWPAGWRKPSAEILKAVAEASKEFDVPEDVILAVIRKESNFDPKLWGYKALKASYARNKDMKIPGSKTTWGEKFTEDQWRAIGVMQVLAFNLFGVKGILKAGAPIEDAFKVRTNVRAGARVLHILYEKYGTWEDAVWKYNGSRVYQREVFAFREEFRAAQVA